MDKPHKQMSLPLTRRTFLAGSVSTGVAALVAPSLLEQALAAEKGAAPGSRKVLTGAHWGAMRARVEGGRFVEALPFEKDRFATPWVQYTPDYVYSASRVKYPMVRTGYLEKGVDSDTSERGEGAFVRVSWEQALDLVAEELARVREQHGPAAIFAGNQNWKSAGRLHNAGTALTRLLNLHGGYGPAQTNYSTGASSYILSIVLGQWDPFRHPTAWPVVVESSELVVMWGADPVKNLKVSWLVPTHAGYDGLEALKKSGKKVVVIDPFRSYTAEYLDARWLAPRPGSDVAMMLGIAHTLYTEKLHDEEFLDEYTVGFERFRAYLTGEADGQPKTAEWASERCEIDAGALKELAREMAKRRTMLMGGWSLQRADHGEQAHWMLITLAAMLGQIGLPGGGFGLGYHYGSAGAPQADAPVLGGLPSGASPKDAPPPIPGTRISDALLNPGKIIDYADKKVAYPDIRLIYWAGGNPFSHQQDRNKLVRAWRKPETIVVNEQFWTATARFADIVLPATTSFERNDIEQVGEYTGQFIIPMRKVIEPLFEARNDFDIFAGIAERLGIGEAFTEGKDEMKWIESFYNAALRQATMKGIAMPSFSEFWDKGEYLEFPIPESERNWIVLADYRKDPLLQPLGTATGRIEIYSKRLEKLGHDDCPPHPTWIEPAEWLGGEKAATHPLHLVSPHPAGRLHSQMTHLPQRERYTLGGREPVWISTRDAEARGIRHGDVVRVFNDRGQVLAGACVTDRLRRGVVSMDEGGWYDPAVPGEPGSLCKYGDVNVLTLDKGTSKLAQATVAHTALVQVEKYAGPPPQVTAFAAPEPRPTTAARRSG